MTKWTIYSKDGTPKHESVTEYNSDGKIVYQDTFEYSGKWMGECFLTVSIKSAYPIDFQIGDYIEYRGEKFTINYDPTVIKKAKRGSYGEGFTYDSIKFNSYSNELTEIMFHDWVLSDNQLHYTSLPNFSFYCKDVDDLADRLQANTDRWCKANGFDIADYWMFYTLKNNTNGTSDSGQSQTTFERTKQRAQDISIDTTFLASIESNWKSVYGDGDDYADSRDDERYDRTITASSQTVWDMMTAIKQQFGLNFVIRGRNVYIGTAGVPTEHLFEYGKGKGLYEVDKTADQDQKVVTKLHAYGDSTNLPTRYYAELNTQAYATVTNVIDNKKETNLYVNFDIDLKYYSKYFNNPLSQYGSDIYAVKISIDGIVINARASKWADNTYVRMYAECYDGATDADDNTDATNFGLFQNALAVGKSMVFVSGVKRDAFEAEHLTYATENLPDNMAVNSLMLPGFPNNSLADLCKAEYDSASNTTKYYIRKTTSSDYVLFHTESGNHVVTFSDNKHDPYIVSPNATELGIKEGDISCTESNDDNGLEAVYPTIEEMTVSDAGLGNGTTRIDAVVKADTIEDNGVYPSDETDNIQGFNIYIPNLGFELDDAISDAGGSEAKITMQNGFCGGRTFDIANVEKQTDGTWRLNCKRTHDDDLDLWFPYSYAASVQGVSSSNAYQILAGDNFVLTGLYVSDVNYVWAASVKLLRKAIHWLCKNDYTRYVYTPKIDEIYMARQDKEAKADTTGATKSLHDTLKEGDMLLFRDDDLLLDGAVFIDQLNIKENGNNGIPTYEVSLRNEITVGTLQRIQNQVDSISSTLSKGGGGVSATSVDSLTKAYGSKYFLSKLNKDTAQKLITFLEGIALGDGTHGITAEGAATLLSIISEKWGITNEGAATLLSVLSEKWGITEDGVATLAGIFAEYLKSKDFKEGYLDGKGFGLYKDDSDDGVMQVDKLFVTKKATFAELEVRKLSYVGGDQVHSNAGSVIQMVKPLDSDGNEIASDDTTTTVDSYKCYFLDDDGTTRTQNWWRTGDMAWSQTFNIEAGVYQDVSNRIYRRLVLRTGSEEVVTGTDEDGNDITKQMGYVVLSNRANDDPFELTSDGYYPTSDTAASDIISYNDTPIIFTGMAPGITHDTPAAEDKIVQIGSQSDSDRGYAYIIYVTEQRRVDYAGISDWDLSIHAVAQYSPKESFAYSKYFQLRSGDAGSWHPQTDYRGDYSDDIEYSYYDSVTYDGLLWLHIGTEATTGDRPGFWSDVWKCVSDGGNELRIEFESDRGNVVYVDNVDLTLTAHLAFGQKYYDDILLQSVNNLTWTRDSGVESEDNSWTATTGDTRNVLIISHHKGVTGDRLDLGSLWESRLRCAFTFTAVIYPNSDTTATAETVSETATFGNS